MALDRRRHYRALADLVDADGVLPVIEPGVLFEGDDIGRWLQRQKNMGSKAQVAFQLGLAALAQWVEREGDRPVPRGAVVEIEVDGGAESVPVRLGVWISNTQSRRDRLDAEQLDAAAEARYAVGVPPGAVGR